MKVVAEPQAEFTVGKGKNNETVESPDPQGQNQTALTVSFQSQREKFIQEHKAKVQEEPEQDRSPPEAVRYEELSAMATEEELLEQKRTIEERKLGLEKYQSEIRRIQVEIVCSTYRRNSGIGSCIEHDEAIRNLKKELESQITGLKRDYGITDRFIPHQIAEYDVEIFRIRKQLDKYVPETANPFPSQLRERSCDGGRDR